MEWDKSDIEDLMTSYYKKKFFHEMQNSVLRGFFPSDSETLDTKAKKLDIAYKKKMLGMPLTSEDYVDSVNKEEPIIGKAFQLTALGASYIGNQLGNKKKPLESMKIFNKPSKFNFFQNALKFKK
jgi:hypothetical protein